MQNISATFHFRVYAKSSWLTLYKGSEHVREKSTVKYALKRTFINYFTVECDGRKYGMECSQMCGKCYRSEQCHHLNGSCPNGCDVGIFGENCVTGFVTACLFLLM